MDFTNIISVASLLLGGGGIGGVLAWRWTVKRERGEARQAENQATKELQDIYQQLIADVKTDRDEQKVYIGELKSDRNHLREENENLRQRQDKLESELSAIKRDVARNGRMVESMRPFLCGMLNCPDRMSVNLSELGDRATRRKEKKDNNHNKQE